MGYTVLGMATDEVKRPALAEALDLAAHPEKHHHHIPDAEYNREITIVVYTPENRAHFDAESSRIIDAP